MVARIVENVLTTVYEISGVSVLLAVLFMFAWLYCSEHGAKEGIRRWLGRLKTDPEFRKMLLFVLYTAMLLCKTLLARRIWHDPFKNVIGIWSFRDEKGELYTENIENVILFLPYIFLLLWALEKHLWKKRRMSAGRILVTGAVISILTSAFIETAQILFRVGSIQLSDLVFNTAGGIAGSLIYILLFFRTKKRIYA